MSKKPIDFYIEEREIFESDLAVAKKQLVASGLLRLFLFFLICFGGYYFFGQTKVLLPLLIGGIALFLFLVSRHTDLELKKRKTQALLEINENEIAVLNGEKAHLDTGDEFLNPEHEFSYDIDLFGKNSFFQYLNRTVTRTGKNKLASTITENTIDDIIKKQNALKELAKKPKWRQNFSATASLVSITTQAKDITDWIKNHTPFLPKIMRFLPIVFFLFSTSLFILNYFTALSFTYIVVWFFLGLGISSIYLKKVTQLYKKASLAKDTFKQYHQLLYQIEKENFTSELLRDQQDLIKTTTKKASTLFVAFSKALDALDQRNNILFGIFGNAFALWDYRQAYKIEKWISQYSDQVENWFEVIAFFDAQNSMANYVFNHPDHYFPEINSTDFSIEASQLGHPLINKNKRVTNDLTINNETFFIITGANMAGKSTFLRTVSLSIVMANAGLPVCATSFNYSPIKLITSMRTSDSLGDDESYFFSELKRLKFIVEKIRTQKHFIVLDEILKGTNSHDKAKGSRKFVERLVNNKATGIIATHDLSLCEIAKEQEKVINYYFDAEIIKEELHFDYILKKGICQNMNASFLLDKMGIV